MGIHLVWKRMNVCEKYRLDSLEIGKIPSMKNSMINQSSNDQAVARNTATLHMEQIPNIILMQTNPHRVICRETSASITNHKGY